MHIHNVNNYITNFWSYVYRVNEFKEFNGEVQERHKQNFPARNIGATCTRYSQERSKTNRGNSRCILKYMLPCM